MIAEEVNPYAGAATASAADRLPPSPAPAPARPALRVFFILHTSSAPPSHQDPLLPASFPLKYAMTQRC